MQKDCKIYQNVCKWAPLKSLKISRQVSEIFLRKRSGCNNSLSSVRVKVKPCCMTIFLQLIFSWFDAGLILMVKYISNKFSLLHTLTGSRWSTIWKRWSSYTNKKGWGAVVDCSEQSWTDWSRPSSLCSSSELLILLGEFDKEADFDIGWV